MTPTYNQVMAWNHGALDQIVPGLHILQQALLDEAPKAANPVLNLTGQQWYGQARGPADDRAEAIQKWLRGTAGTFQSLQTALTDGSSDIADAKSALSARKALADKEGYILNQDDPGYTVTFTPARAPEDAVYDANTAHEHQTALNNLGIAADNAVTTTHDAINAHLAAIEQMTPASIAANNGTVDPTLAAGDVAAIHNGTATPEQRGRFLRAMRLSPEQLVRLQLGKPVDIDPSKLAYIKNALGAVDVGTDGVSGLKAFEQFAANDPRLHTAMVNGLQVVSNRNVHAGNQTGGFGNLPASIKDTLTRQDAVVWAGPMLKLNGVGDASALGRLLASGDSRYQAGTDVDRKLGDLSRQYTDALAKRQQEQHHSILTIDGKQPESAQGAVDSLSDGIQDMLRGVGRDKMWVHDAFTDPHYGQDFVHDLMTTEWHDDGKAAGTLMDINPNDAHSESFGVRPEQQTLDQQLDQALSARSSDIMEAVLKYAGSHSGYGTLMDIPGAADGKSVGELNPELMRTLAHSFKPYIGELGGENDPSLVGFNNPGENLIHSPGTQNFEGSSRLFGLIATDETAAKDFYGEVYRQIGAQAAAWAATPSDGDAAHRLALMSHLRGLSDEGLLYAAQERAGDDYAAAQKAFELKGKILDDAFKVSDLATGQVTEKAPGSNILLDHAKEALKQSLLGPAPSSDDFDPAKYKLDLDQSSTGSVMGDLQAAIISNTSGDVRSQLDPGLAQRLADRQWFNSDGSLRTRAEILAAGRTDENGIAVDTRTIISQLAAKSNNSNPLTMPDDYRDVWDTSEELGDKWTLNVPR